MKLSDFDVLSFDCYGTLIDWESGIFDALAPLRARAGGTGQAGMGLARADVVMSRDAVLEAFARLESHQQETTPDMLYPAVLAAVHRRMAVEWDVAPDTEEDLAFGKSIGNWPPFPDTVDALRTLKQDFRLVILSNIDRDSFQATNRLLGVAFDDVFTAQDIGSYKPDPANFRYLLDRLREQGTPLEKVLHVAQSLFHDHVPAKALGMTTAWIDRRHVSGGSGATAPVCGDVGYDFRFESLAALAAAHRAGDQGPAV